jgi:hypothetical protein
MASADQQKAFVDYMTAQFPLPATILPNKEAQAGSLATRYRVSVRESSGVERWVFATYEFLDSYTPDEIRTQLEAWGVAGIARATSATQAVLVTRDEARIVARP